MAILVPEVMQVMKEAVLQTEAMQVKPCDALHLRSHFLRTPALLCGRPCPRPCPAKQRRRTAEDGAAAPQLLQFNYYLRAGKD